MPARPMYRSPHKRTNGWAKGYLPEFGRQSGSTSGSGAPEKKKMLRVKTGPPGSPQGTHIKELRSGDICFCGGCYSRNRGDLNLVRG
jgi:hypothetical protein